MSKNIKSKEPMKRKYMREFVNNVINKDYAHANANLGGAVKEAIKSRVVNILQENP